MWLLSKGFPNPQNSYSRSQNGGLLPVLQAEKLTGSHIHPVCACIVNLCPFTLWGQRGKERCTWIRDALLNTPPIAHLVFLKKTKLSRKLQPSVPLPSSLPDTSAGSSAVLSSSVGWWLIAPVNHHAAARYSVYFSDSNLVLALFHTCHCVFFLTLEVCRKRTVINGAIHPRGNSFIILW